MNLYLLYEPSSGEIIANLVGSPGCSAEVDGKQLPSIDVGPVEEVAQLGFVNPNTAYPSDEFYVDPASLTLLKRPVMPLPSNPIKVKADGQTEIEIFPIPNGANCLYDGENHTISGNKLTFSAEHTGTYEFTFSLFPWVPATVTVEGVAP